MFKIPVKTGNATGYAVCIRNSVSYRETSAYLHGKLQVLPGLIIFLLILIISRE
jgi:hypothetical protein